MLLVHFRLHNTSRLGQHTFSIYSRNRLTAAETKIAPRLFASLEMFFRLRVGALYTSAGSIANGQLMEAGSQFTPLIYVTAPTAARDEN